jgi:uncharacterized membrane protein
VSNVECQGIIDKRRLVRHLLLVKVSRHFLNLLQHAEHRLVRHVLIHVYHRVLRYVLLVIIIALRRFYLTWYVPVKKNQQAPVFPLLQQYEHYLCNDDPHWQ